MNQKKIKQIAIYPDREQTRMLENNYRGCQALREFFIDLYRECYNVSKDKERKVPYPTSGELTKILSKLRNKEDIVDIEFSEKNFSNPCYNATKDEYNAMIKPIIMNALGRFYKRNSMKVKSYSQFHELLKECSFIALKSALYSLVLEYRRFFKGSASYPKYQIMQSIHDEHYDAYSDMENMKSDMLLYGSLYEVGSMGLEPPTIFAIVIKNQVKIKDNDHLFIPFLKDVFCDRINLNPEKTEISEFRIWKTGQHSYVANFLYQTINSNQKER